jgi:hypothetical protein
MKSNTIGIEISQECLKIPKREAVNRKTENTMAKSKWIKEQK